MKRRKFFPITMTAIAVLLVVLLALSRGAASLQLGPHVHIVLRRWALELGYCNYMVRSVGSNYWWTGTGGRDQGTLTLEPPHDTWYPTRRTGGGIFRFGGESRSLSVTIVTIPLILPTVLATALAIWLWTRHLRRKPRALHCATCDYDLTGNTSGRCPECGQPVARSAQE